MTKTEQMLFDRFKSPAVNLHDVCVEFFGVDRETANRKALLHQLPMPAWRACNSRKAPFLVSIVDLARHLDAVHEAAAKEFERSQV